MKIALDAGPLSDGNAGRGVGVYTQLLYKALLKLKDSNDVVIEAVDAHKIENDSDFDLIHYPTFDFFKNTLKIDTKIPVVVTIHDTIPLIYPDKYPAGIKGSVALFRQKRALRKASAIITDSETSKKDIVRFLKIDPSKIHPIYLGPTVLKPSKELNAQKILKNFNISFPYVLYIGDVNWNKNLVSLCKACDAIETHLVIVGKRANSTTFDRQHIENQPLVELQRFVKQSSFIHTIGFVEDKELPTLIVNAQLLCQPSYYEGFGLSVLDAMKLGTPTACAKTQALVEIYEEGSIFFDPYDVNNMSTTIRTVLKSAKLRSTLRLKGLRLSTRFTWKSTAEETLAVYKSVLLHK